MQLYFTRWELKAWSCMHLDIQEGVGGAGNGSLMEKSSQLSSYSSLINVNITPTYFYAANNTPNCALI